MVLVWCDTLYLLTASGLTPGGSSTVYIYAQTINRTAIKYKQNIVKVTFDYILSVFYNSVQHNRHVLPESYTEQR